MNLRLGAGLVGVGIASLLACAGCAAPGLERAAAGEDSAPSPAVAPFVAGVGVGAKSPGGADADVARYDTDAATDTLTAGRRYPLLLDAQRGLVLGAGTATVGTFTVAEPVDVSGTAGTAVQQGMGAGTAATLRTTIATDDVVSVDDNAASLTMDSAQLPAALVGGRLDVVVGAALPAGANNIGDVDIATINGQAPAFGAGAAGATVLRVTQSTDDAGATSLAALDDLVRGEDSAHATLDSGVMALAVASDVASTLAGTDGDYAPALITRLGATRTVAQPERYVDSLGAVYLVQTAFTTVTTAGAAEIQAVAAQGANNSIVLIGYRISSSASQTTTQWETGSGAAITMQTQNATADTFESQFRLIAETTDNEALELQVSTAATVSVQVWYFVR